MPHYYYADKDNRPTGPKSWEELQALKASGEIADTTFLILEGGQRWVPFSEVAASLSDGPPPPPRNSVAQRPVSVTVFSIIFIIFGAIALIATPASFLITRFVPAAPGAAPGAWNIWMTTTTVVGMLSGAVELAMGIGMLRLRPWARLVSLGWSVFSILYAIAACVVILTMPELIYGNMLPQTSGPEAQMMRSVVILSAVAGTLFSTLLPILALIFLTRRKIVEAFHPERMRFEA